MDRFCTFSGHKINAQKTNIFFFKGVDDELKGRLSGLLGFQFVPVGTYLGVSLFHKRVTKATVGFLVDKIRAKLSNWDARKLSVAGRFTFAQSVLLTIPNYFMQTMRIPIGICEEIEGLARRFIWGSNSRKQKRALVDWNSMCQPRMHGGLGIRKLED